MGNRRKARPNMGPKLADRIRAIEKTLTGKYNGYICESCGKGFLTMDIDEGTTPPFTPCYATYGCRGVARSMGYPDNEPPAELGDPILYWYKPSVAEFRKLSVEMQEHVLRGGLVRRATEAAPQWVKMAA